MKELTTIQARLLALQDEAYRAFHKSLVPTLQQELIGVRVPQVLPLEADELRPIRVRDMSGGMKKLCNLVCTLVAAPDILLLDEPYAALDEAHAAMLAAYLAAFTAGGGSLLIAAHDAKEYRTLTGRRLLLVGDGSMREETFAQAESPV